jgi:voltage-gated potassium channel
MAGTNPFASNLPWMDERSERIQKRFEWPMLVAALLVIPVIVVEESDYGQPWETIASVINWGIWLAFLSEAILMLSVVPRKRTWLARHPLDVLIVVFTPPFLPAALQSLRVLRLLRVLRIIRALPAARHLFAPEGFRWVALVATTIIVGSGAIFAAAESDQNLTTWDGIWWSITTVTTVGYGDISPETDVGRTIAIVVMVTGIGFVAFVTAAIAERFIHREVRAAVEEGTGDAEAEILSDVRDMRQRLDRIEQRLTRRPT